MNSVQLVGNLARDPELRKTNSGISVCTFTVACQRRFKNDNGQYDADFINCVAWRQTAEFVQKYFIKGNKIGLIGTLQTRSYDAQDGSKRYVTEVVVDNVEFVAARAESQLTHSAAPSQQSAPAQQQPRNEQMRMDTSGYYAEDDDDELPF